MFHRVTQTLQNETISQIIVRTVPLFSFPPAAKKDFAFIRFVVSSD